MAASNNASFAFTNQSHFAVSSINIKTPSPELAPARVFGRVGPSDRLDLRAQFDVNLGFVGGVPQFA